MKGFGRRPVAGARGSTGPAFESLVRRKPRGGGGAVGLCGNSALDHVLRGLGEVAEVVAEEDVALVVGAPRRVLGCERYLFDQSPGQTACRRARSALHAPFFSFVPTRGSKVVFVMVAAFS